MSGAIDFRLIANNDIFSVIPLLQVLNPRLSEATLAQRLSEMPPQGYRCMGAYDGAELVGICGMWMMTKIYVGKHIEPDNVVVLPAYREQGLGARLLAQVYAYGLAQGCVASELNCYISNLKGQSFWEKEGFEKIGYHYQKSL